MPSPSPTTSPIFDPNEWMYFTLAGVPSPGTIPRDGVKGFKRESGWEIVKGKGTQGATLKLTTLPPVKGTFTLQLFKSDNQSDDFKAWDRFCSQVLSINPKQQQEQGLTIYYPGFASIGLTLVVVESYGPLLHKGKGMYHGDVSLIEWQQPPPASIVQTVNNAAADKNGGVGAPRPVDPRISALQNQIGLLNQARRAVPGGP